MCYLGKCRVFCLHSEMDLTAAPIGDRDLISSLIWYIRVSSIPMESRSFEDQSTNSTLYPFITFWKWDGLGCWTTIRLMRGVDKSCTPDLHIKIRFLILSR